jgi:HAMP domain-containing protein
MMAAAMVLLFGPLRLEPTRLTEALIVVAALGVGAVVNFLLVRLALRPVKDIARIAWLVSEGVRGERVPESIVADSELIQLSATINQLLDELVSERIQINKLAADIANSGGSDGRRRRFDRRVSGVQR